MRYVRSIHIFVSFFVKFEKKNHGSPLGGLGKGGLMKNINISISHNFFWSLAYLITVTSSLTNLSPYSHSIDLRFQGGGENGRGW